MRDQLPAINQCQLLVGYTDDHICAERGGEASGRSEVNEKEDDDENEDK